MSSSLAPTGSWYVFEKGGYLYKLNPSTKVAEQIHITLSSDLVYARAERMNVGKKGRNSYSLSPDGRGWP
jgi:tricorn protease